MGDSISLGRIAGIRIGINWSWLVVFGLITWSLSENVFPNQNPGLSNNTYLVMAIAASLLFFLSLLLHELGHAFEARREGMEIEGITLWLFGGVAKFRGNFPSAGAEFRIAVAGPLVSLVIGVLFVLVAWGLPLTPSVDGAAAWLGYINLVLLVFNLLPALPLDGGRILRSFLWQVKGSFAWATRVSSTIGRILGGLLIGLGLFMALYQGVISGIWLAFVGWFLLQAAAAEGRFLAARQALEGLRVGDLTLRNPVVVSPGLSLARFMGEVAWGRPFAVYPVAEDGRALGLVSVNSVMEVPRVEWADRRVRDRMLPSERVPILAPDEELIDALQEFGGEVQFGLVVDGDGRLVGVLSGSDAARALELRRRGGRLRGPVEI